MDLIANLCGVDDVKFEPELSHLLEKITLPLADSDWSLSVLYELFSLYASPGLCGRQLKGLVRPICTQRAQFLQAATGMAALAILQYVIYS